MDLSTFSPIQLVGGQIAIIALLAIIGFLLLLPRPQARWVTLGTASLIAAVSGLGAWLYTTFGKPMPDLIGTVLFGFFSVGALGFGSVLVTQRNPARGAIAFAFVILSTCGLFLLLAAPFLMAATVIIYAGAIIVTFLFVLMLSQNDGPSDENDRSREPRLGALAGFAFTGLVLFSLYLGSPIPASADTSKAPAASLRKQLLPVVVLNTEEKALLQTALVSLDSAGEQLSGDLTKDRDSRIEYFTRIKNTLAEVVGEPVQFEPTSAKTAVSRSGSVLSRLVRLRQELNADLELYRQDHQARAVVTQAVKLQELNAATYRKLETNLLDANPNSDLARAEVAGLREEVLLLMGMGELPASNVSNLGYQLYTEYLLAVELAGALLLVASLGAVAIARRKGVPS